MQKQIADTKGFKKLTSKQKTVFSLLSDNVGISTAQAMRKAGYSLSTSRQPQRLTKSANFADLARKYLPDNKLLAVATAGLDADKVIRYKGETFTDPDYYARHQYLETALRIRNLAQSDDIPLGDITLNVINYADATPNTAQATPIDRPPINIDAQVIANTKDGGQVEDSA
jgi:hypothetical protein